MGYILEYRNGFFSTALIGNSDFAESLNMIGVVAGPSAMWVLNNKSYSSSPRPFRFVKFGVYLKDPCTNLRGEMPAQLAILNLTRKSDMFVNIDDGEVDNIIQAQIQENLNNEKIRKKWENTRDFIKGVPLMISDESLFL